MRKITFKIGGLNLLQIFTLRCPGNYFFGFLTNRFLSVENFETKVSSNYFQSISLSRLISCSRVLHYKTRGEISQKFLIYELSYDVLMLSNSCIRSTTRYTCVYITYLRIITRWKITYVEFRQNNTNYNYI